MSDLNGNNPPVGLPTPNESRASLIENATAVEDSIRFRSKKLFVAGIILLATSIYLDNFYTKHGIRFSESAFCLQHWIMYVTLVGYLMGSGILTFFSLEFLRYEIITYFIPSNQLSYIVRVWMDVFIGICVPIYVLPIWISVREGTLECFISRDCRNIFGLIYLAVTDVICDTVPSLGKYHPNTLPACEGILYITPLVLFTTIPVILSSSLYYIYYCTILHPQPGPISPEIPIPLSRSQILASSNAHRRQNTKRSTPIAELLFRNHNRERSRNSEAANELKGGEAGPYKRIRLSVEPDHGTVDSFDDLFD